MAAIVISLKWRLLQSGLRGSTSRVLGMILAAMTSLAVLGLILMIEIALRTTLANDQLTTDDVGALLVLAGSATTLGWCLLPMIIFGLDETVDPARFALLPLRGRDLVPGLTGAALLGFPGVTTVLATLGTVICWSISLPAIIAALVSAPLAVLMCVLGSRVLTTAAAGSLSRRRTRDLTAVLGALIAAMIGVVPGLIVIGAPRILDSGGFELLALTPFGWAWAIPADVAGGRYGAATLRFVLCVVLIIALAGYWGKLLDRSFTDQTTGAVTRVRSKGTPLLDRLPQPRNRTARQTVTITVRSLRYWRRDSRYLSLFAPVVIFSALAIMMPKIVTWENSNAVTVGMGLGIGPFTAWAMGLIAVNDAGYDGSAFAAHLLCGVRGVADRAGRVLAWSLVLVPVIVALSAIGSVWAGRADLIPALIGVALAMLLGGLGAGSLLGVLAPFPMPESAQNPFQNNSGGGLTAFLAQIAVGTTTFATALPPALALAASLRGWDPGRWLALPLGVGMGVLVMSVFIVLAGQLLDQRGPEMLATLRRPA